MNWILYFLLFPTPLCFCPMWVWLSKWQNQTEKKHPRQNDVVWSKFKVSWEMMGHKTFCEGTFIKVKDWHTHFASTPSLLHASPGCPSDSAPARSLWWFQKWPGKRPVCHSPPQCDPQPVGSWWQHGEIVRSPSLPKDMLRWFPYYTILWIYVYYTTFWGVASGHETVCPNEWRWLFEILWHCYDAPRVVREWYHFDEKHQGRYFDTQICSTGPYQIWLCFFSLWPSAQVLSCYFDNIEKSE